MAHPAQGASAPTLRTSPETSTAPRRRLAPNVIAMHAEERPPVVQTRRRGRLPASIARFYYGRPRLYVGAVCGWSTSESDFDYIPVRLLEIRADGFCVVAAISARSIPLTGGGFTRRAGVYAEALVRTATITKGASHV